MVGIVVMNSSMNKMSWEIWQGRWMTNLRCCLCKACISDEACISRGTDHPKGEFPGILLTLICIQPQCEYIIVEEPFLYHCQERQRYPRVPLGWKGKSLYDTMGDENHVARICSSKIKTRNDCSPLCIRPSTAPRIWISFQHSGLRIVRCSTAF